VANTFLRGDVIAAQALGLLQRQIVLPGLINSRPIGEFAGDQDDTVTVRIPAVLTARDYEWRTRTAPITVDDVTETSIPVVLDTHIYHAAAITDEQMQLDIRDFGSQVLQPQVRAVAEAMENKIAAGMAAGTYATTLTPTLGTDKPRDIAVDARTALNNENVPMEGRVLVVGADIEADFLKDDHLTMVDQAGTGSALREAVIGRLMGFTIVSSNAIAADLAYAFHPSAFTHVLAAPAVPAGVVTGERRAYEGLAMRWIRDYDTLYLRDRSVLSAFWGFSAIEDGNGQTNNVRAVKIDAV